MKEDTKAKTSRGTIDRKSKLEEKRPKRVSVAAQRNKLTVIGQDPSRYYYWVNDNNDGLRILSLKEAGYRMETDKTLIVGDKRVAGVEGEGTPKRRYAGTDKEGNKVYAYLMSQPMEFHEEDQAEKQREIDLREKGYSTGGDYGEVSLEQKTFG